jgi:hypothetical protein
MLPSVAGVTAVLVTATLLAGGAAAAGPARAAQSDAIVAEPFYANSGDKCEMGYTAGTLGWHVAELRTVDVRGTVADRPWPDDPASPCGDDARYTVAIFTAYSKGNAVENGNLPFPRAGHYEGSNNHQEFSFSLTSSRPIDQMIVQICRRPESPWQHEYCGTPKRYKAPVTTAG